MIGAIKIRERSIILRRGDKSHVNKTLKAAWLNAARYFHDSLRDKRFTVEHAKAAGYAPRKGSTMPVGSKQFWGSYLGRKLRKFGHMRPLEFSGRTRQAVRSYVSLSSTSKGSRAAYPGARVFNFRNPKSDPGMSMNLEFRRILPQEAEHMARAIDSTLDEFWNQKIEEEVTTLLDSAGMGY
jgi:hypothetical protein